MLIRLCLQSFGGLLELAQLLYGPSTCGTNTIRSCIQLLHSHTWRNVIQVREEVKHDTWLQPKAGNSSFWFDSLTKTGALYFTEDSLAIDEHTEVKDYFINGQ